MNSPSPGSQPLQLGMVIDPRMTLLDLAGPQAVLKMHGERQLVWKTLDPVRSDTGTPAAAGPDITRLVASVLETSGESVDKMVDIAKKLSRRRGLAV